MCGRTRQYVFEVMWVRSEACGVCMECECVWESGERKVSLRRVWRRVHFQTDAEQAVCTIERLLIWFLTDNVSDL